MDFPSPVFLARPNSDKSRSDDLNRFRKMEEDRLLKLQVSIQPIKRWIDLQEGNGYYVKTKSKQPRTVFVCKRGEL